jgi:hypothetical protein
MLIHSRMRLLFLAAALATTAVTGTAWQNALPLPIGKAEAGQATNDAFAVYQFMATSAGVLTVTVKGNGDLAMRVIDEDGQALPDGTTDADRNGETGSEMLAVVVTEPGMYRVQVKMQENGVSRFQIGASWIPFPALAVAPDPDRRPSQARVIDIGKSYEDSLGTPGDRVDWFAFAPKTAGTLTVVLRSIGDSKIDLMIEVFLAKDMNEPVGRSDQDLQDNPANESVAVDVPPGQKVFVKVTSAMGSSMGRYRISSSFIE